MRGRFTYKNIGLIYIDTDQHLIKRAEVDDTGMKIYTYTWWTILFMF